MNKTLTGICVLALAALVGCGPAASRTGADVDPVTLVVAQEAPILDELVSATRKDAVTVATSPVVPDSADEDSAMLAALAAGDIDLASIRSGRLLREGAASLAPLSAPFLVTNDQQAAAIARDDVAQDLMSSLADLDLVGLALVPQGLRHPFGYGDEPLLGAADYVGQRVWSPLDQGSADILTALGAQVDHSGDADRTRLAHSGELRGIETHLARFGSVDRPAVVTANVSLYDRIDVLVVRRPVWEELSPAQQEQLRGSVVKAQDTVLEAMPGEAALFEEWCHEEGAASANATDAQLASLHRALDPITDAMASDPATRAGVMRMRELGEGTQDVGRLECPAAPDNGGSGTDAPIQAAGDQTVLDGLLRFAVDEQELLAAGASESDASGNAGVWQMQVEHGAAEVTGPGGSASSWTFTFNGPRVALDFGVDGGALVGTYAVDGDVVRFAWKVAADDPYPWIGKVLFAEAVRVES